MEFIIDSVTIIDSDMMQHWFSNYHRKVRRKCESRILWSSLAASICFCWVDSCVVELQNVVELRVVDVLHYVTFSDSLELYIILQHSTIQNITLCDSVILYDLITGLTGLIGPLLHFVTKFCARFTTVPSEGTWANVPGVGRIFRAKTERNHNMSHDEHLLWTSLNFFGYLLTNLDSKS